jgi:hypothetical protein
MLKEGKYFQIPFSISEKINKIRADQGREIESKRDPSRIYKYHGIAHISEAMYVQMQNGNSTYLSFQDEQWDLKTFGFSDQDKKLYVDPNKLDIFHSFLQQNPNCVFTMYHSTGAEGFDYDVIRVLDENSQVLQDFTYHRSE